jgi:predicted N-acetyltransferase YhbS
MKSPEVELVLGKELSPLDLETINYQRRIEFHSTSDIQPVPGNEDWDTPFFLARNEQGQLVGFGRLHHLEVRFRGSDYAILGLASILAIEKGKGVGRRMVDKMKQFIRDRKMTAIGFCDPEDSAFYDKCGFGVIKDGTSWFEFPSGPKSAQPGDVIYLEGEDGLIEGIINHPGEKVRTFRPEW